MISVAIIEDDQEIRTNLALIVDGTPGYSCQHLYEDCETAIQDIANHDLDVILMDIGLPGMSGIEGTRLIKEELPGIDIIMLTVLEDDHSVFESLCAGATGYLIKDTSPVELLQSIEEVCEGGSPMSTSIARKVVQSFRGTRKNPLTKRENEILQLLCKGYNYKAIAETLYLSGYTVRQHIKNIYSKLHVSSRAEMVNKAIRARWI